MTTPPPGQRLEGQGTLGERSEEVLCCTGSELGQGKVQPERAGPVQWGTGWGWGGVGGGGGGVVLR